MIRTLKNEQDLDVMMTGRGEGIFSKGEGFREGAESENYGIFIETFEVD